jgi:2-iminobutanoate/2-iminopropanoate deaminase
MGQTRAIRTDRAPAPGGHYSQAIVHGDVMYVSGQLPIEPGRPPHSPHQIPSIEIQTRQALANLEAILIAGGSNLQNVLKTTVYISDISLWGAVNLVYTEVFGGSGAPAPARAVIPCGVLHYGYQIEIEALARIAPATGSGDHRS